ncbi:MAG: hypothetical protein NDI81_21295 [Desulfobacula sp.]|nr:hypothetical protein [Desulfobacula sp.]
MIRKALWARTHAPIVVVLSIIVIALLVAVLFRYDYINTALLVSHKDFIDVTSKILTSIILIFGAAASYFRFFRGRTLSPRLKMSASVAVFEATDSENLHVLSIIITNIGSVAIWNPEPQAEVVYHGIKSEKDEVIDQWWAPMLKTDSAKRLPMVDTSEEAQYVVQRLVPKDVYAVTYFAQISLESGHSWHRSVTVSNKFRKQVEEEKKDLI